MPVWTYSANRVATELSASEFHARAPCGPSEPGNERVEVTNCRVAYDEILYLN